MSTPCAIDALDDRVPVFEADRFPADLSERERSSRMTHVAVVDAAQTGRFLGLLSLKDLMERRRGAELIFGDLVARKKTLRIGPQMPLAEVVDQLIAHKHDAAAVVNEEGEYLGAVTIDEARQRLETHRAETRADDERHFRAIFEQAAVGVAQVAPDGRWLDVNPRLCAIVGYTREELLSGSFRFQDITHPDDLSASLEQFRRILAGEISTSSMEKRYRRKDGSSAWIRVWVSLVRDEQAKPSYWVKVIEDVDARKQAEARLVEAAANIKLMVKASNIGLWDWDLSTNRVHFSREWKGQLGHAEHEITDDFGEWERRVHPDDLAPTLARIQRYLADPSVPHEAEFRMRHKNGSWRWIYARAELGHDASGKPTRMRGCHIDVTESKRLVEAAKASEAFLREAIDAIAASTALVIEDGSIVMVNRSWREFAASNGGGSGAVHEGLNYLSVCDAAQNEHSEAGRVGRMLRSVVAGEPDLRRWSTPATRPPRSDGSGHGSAVSNRVPRGTRWCRTKM